MININASKHRLLLWSSFYSWQAPERCSLLLRK